MSTTINKTNYPFLFGPNSTYAILSQSGLTSATNTTVNNGDYGCK